jgi:hypothetical protein
MFSGFMSLSRSGRFHVLTLKFEVNSMFEISPSEEKWNLIYCCNGERKEYDIDMKGTN